MTHETRIQKLREIMIQKKLDAIVIPSFEHSSPNLYYFTEYEDCGPNFFIILPDDEILLTWECIRAKKESKVKNCASILNIKISNYLKKRGLDKTNIGIDGSVKYSFVVQLKERLPKIKLVDIQTDLMTIRSIKETSEIENIRSACLISDRILRELKSDGIPKNDLILKQYMNKKIVNLGHQWSFDTLVAGDENSSRIHYFPKNSHFKNIVLIDFGVQKEKYTSDITRTFILKKNDKMQKAMDALITLQHRMDEILEPGIKAKDISLYARTILEKAGYTTTNFSNFHSLGHGVGLETHEYPILSEKSTDVLEKDMVFTLEPAIYFPGEFGIRLEDTVVMRGTGIKRLSKTPFE